MMQQLLKQEQEIENLTTRNNELQKVQDRYSITKQEQADDIEAKEDLIATLEESLEEAKYQVK